MFIKFLVRADSRALIGAVLIGAASGALLGGSYLAGGAVRAAAAHTRMAQLASATAGGFSEAALRAEASTLPPGALAVARRHDPFTAAGAAERDLQTALLTARLELSAPAHAGPLLRTSFSNPTVPVRPFHLQLENALASSRELDCLSQAVYYEARGESSEGQAAVAQVVLNRLRHPGFPKTVCGVVYQGAQDQACQFSFACDGAARAAKEMTAWRRAQAVAARALGGFVEAQVGDATHFHVASLGAIWGEGLVRVAQIGAHSFYRLTGHPSGIVHAAPGLYAPASELADRPVYAEAKATPATADANGPTLILASAVTAAPLAPNGPLRAAAEAAPAAVPGNPADKSAASGPQPPPAKGAG